MSSPPILINVVIAALAGDRCPLLCPMCGSTQVQPVRVSCHPAGPAGGVVCVDVAGVHIDRSFHADDDVPEVGSDSRRKREGWARPARTLIIEGRGSAEVGRRFRVARATRVGRVGLWAE